MVRKLHRWLLLAAAAAQWLLLAAAAAQPTPWPTAFPTDGCEGYLFTRHVLDAPWTSGAAVVAAGVAATATSALAAGAEGDGDAAGRLGWFENDGDFSVGRYARAAAPARSTTSFEERAVDAGSAALASVFAVDVDGDADVDVVAGAGDLAWYENDGSQSFAKRAVLATERAIRDVVAADVGGDGAVDAVVAGPDDPAVLLFENDGSRRSAAEVASPAHGADAGPPPRNLPRMSSFDVDGPRWSVDDVDGPAPSG
ncbi:hypothetical protein JL722_5135 [Aureococcus anophagefferens]|nr:hypothetical protein JL722_5135 [Aureococcus anophagefferens]